MNRFESVTGPLIWFMAWLIVALTAGCGGGGGGGGGQDPTSGSPPADLSPTVSGTTNANGATNVAINSIVGATFSEAMDPKTITTTTFFLMQGTTAVPAAVSYSGVSAVLIPLSNLAPSTRYTVTVKGGAGGAKDLAANALASDYVWAWTTGVTPDTVPPTVTGTIHANGATNVAINTKVGATFSEAMDPFTITTTTFSLMQGTTAVPAAVSYSGVSAVLIPLSNLAPNTGYTVTVKGGVGGAKDLAENSLASDYVLAWTTGAASDTVPPTVSGTTNANGATNVAINSKVGATFSEAMDPSTITTKTFFLMQGTTAVPATVSYSGVSAVLIPLSNLAPNTGYTVTVKGGVGGAKDLAENALASDYVWAWTTRAASDTVLPTVTGTIHANGATNVAINTKVGATFSEAMDPSTITTETFFLMQGTTAVPATVSYSGVSAVLIPFSNLAPNTGYTVTVKGGVGGAKDLADNALASDYVLAWTTGAASDTVPPTVSGTVNANGATNVASNTKVGVTFSEAMDPSTITTETFFLMHGTTVIPATVSYSGVSAVLIPFSNLAPNTGYTVTVKGGVGGAKDLADNALASDYVWAWTTGATSDTVLPMVSGTTIANGATNVALNATIGATFSEAMDPLTITNVNCTLTETISGTLAVGEAVSYSGVNVEFQLDMFGPSRAFLMLPNTSYTVTIQGGVGGVADLAGNPLVNDYVWSFTTGAAIPSI